jgi:hypothetical protein
VFASTAKSQVTGFPHNSHEGFNTLEEAEAAFQAYNRRHEGDSDSDGSATSGDGVGDAMRGAIPVPTPQPRGNVGVNKPVKREEKVGDGGVDGDGSVEAGASKGQVPVKKKRWHPPRRKMKAAAGGLENSMACLDLSIRLPKA